MAVIIDLIVLCEYKLGIQITKFFVNTFDKWNGYKQVSYIVTFNVLVSLEWVKGKI